MPAATLPPTPPRPLDGVLVIALEQAVAAPYCTSRLADAGARVIKIERREGDFARGYDHAVHGESSYWVWINRGKESITLDVKDAGDRALLWRLLAQADVFVQNLAPGAAERLGLGSAALRERFTRLITCDISGYGDEGPRVGQKAYDLLVQAESGLIAVSGAPGEGVEALGRIGVSVCDINAGLNALVGIQQALAQRARTGRGSGVSVSLFGSAAELMAVPYLQARYGGQAPARVGLKHPSIAPYGAFTCADGRVVVLSIQNEREWADFCHHVLGRPELLQDPRCADNAARVAHRAFVDGVVAEVFGQHDGETVVARLTHAQTAFGHVNSVHALITHPQLRTRPMRVNGQTVAMPASPWHVEWEAEAFPEAPALDAQGAAIRAEFAAPPAAAAATAPAGPEAVLRFWFDELRPAQWWRVDPALDARIRTEFGALHRAACAGELFAWRATPAGRLAEVIVLDQFSRNMHRGTPQAFAADPMALALAQEAVRIGADQPLAPVQRAFLYLPYMHSESARVHAEAERLYRAGAPDENLQAELKHRAIIERFRRYPHRNAILGRASTEEEQAFLQTPGSSF